LDTESRSHHRGVVLRKYKAIQGEESFCKLDYAVVVWLETVRVAGIMILNIIPKQSNDNPQQWLS